MKVELIVAADTIHSSGSGEVQAVAIADGEIVATGSREEIRQWRSEATQVHDFGAATIAAGLTDSHSHPVMGLQLARGVDLSGVQDLETFRRLLAEEVARTPGDDWVLGWGVDPNAFADSAATNRVLADIIGDRQMALRMFDAHGMLVSQRTLVAAGITGAETFDERAEVVCDEHGPTGLLLEFPAFADVAAIIPVQSATERAQALLELLGAMRSTGITAAHVMDAESDSLEVLAIAEELGELPIELVVAPWCFPDSDDAWISELIRMQGTGGRRWRIGAVKFMIDGTIDNGTAWLAEPDAFGESVESYWPDPKAYTAAVQKLASAGVATTTHAIGDAAVAHVLRTLAQVPSNEARHRIEHIETLPDPLLSEFARLGVIASMQPSHCAHFTKADCSDNWSTRVGAQRSSRGWRSADLRAAGVRVALGSDWPVAPFDARRGIAEAILRRPALQPEVTPVNPAQGLSPRQVLEGYTSHAAAAVGQEQVCGEIAPGFQARLSVFGLDPLRVDADEFAETPVLGSVVRGQLHLE